MLASQVEQSNLMSLMSIMPAGIQLHLLLTGSATQARFCRLQIFLELPVLS